VQTETTSPMTTKTSQLARRRQDRRIGGRDIQRHAFGKVIDRAFAG
jgi:hypothetical protein